MNYIYLLADAGDLCTKLEPLLRIIGFIILLLKIATPILLIVIGMIELIKAMASKDEREMQAAQSGLVKKAIAAVCVFLVATLVGLLTNLIGDSAQDYKQCAKCLNHPASCNTASNGGSGGGTTSGGTTSGGSNNNANKLTFVKLNEVTSTREIKKGSTKTMRADVNTSATTNITYTWYIEGDTDSFSKVRETSVLILKAEKSSGSVQVYVVAKDNDNNITLSSNKITLKAISSVTISEDPPTS